MSLSNNIWNTNNPKANYIICNKNWKVFLNSLNSIVFYYSMAWHRCCSMSGESVKNWYIIKNFRNQYFTHCATKTKASNWAAGRVVNASYDLCASGGECIFIAYFQAANKCETLSILLCCISKSQLEEKSSLVIFLFMHFIYNTLIFK